MIQYTIGNAANPPRAPGFNVIAHCVNNNFLWGAGFVLALDKHHPTAKQQYLDFHATRKLTPPEYLGKCLLTYSIHPVDGSTWVIANIFGQNGIRSFRNPHPIDYIALSNALMSFRMQLLTPEMTERPVTIHMPRIETNLAGGDWTIIEGLINALLPEFTVLVYDLPK